MFSIDPPATHSIKRPGEITLESQDGSVTSFSVPPNESSTPHGAGRDILTFNSTSKNHGARVHRAASCGTVALKQNV